ncbi:MAG: hypothetical protein ACNI25_12265 [Halarcobacter sp.]
MQTYILEKGFIYKLFMLTAFSLFALVMYQGYVKGETIYSILFFGSISLCAFQIASIFYVIFVQRRVELTIDDENISWKIYDNKKLYKENSIQKNKIKEIKTEINYLMGNIYSNFTVTFILDDDSEDILTDGLIYDFTLKKAEDLCRFLLKNKLGHEQDVKFSTLVEELNIDLTKEQVFSKKAGKSYFVGLISKNKKEFLSLRLQIENLYPNYKVIEKNANNEYLIKSDEIKDSYIYLRSNAIGYFVEFYNVSKKEELKSLKQMGEKEKIGF